MWASQVMKSDRTEQPSWLVWFWWILHRRLSEPTFSAYTENVRSKTATRCNLGNLGHPWSNYSWWILTFGGLTLSSVSKSSNRARRGRGIHFWVLRHNNLLFQLLLLYMRRESWEIKMGKAKLLMQEAQINKIGTVEVVPRQRRAREIRD